MCVRKSSVRRVLQFTPFIGASSVLHRPASRVIHRLQLYCFYSLNCHKEVSTSTKPSPSFQPNSQIRVSLGERVDGGLLPWTVTTNSVATPSRLVAFRKTSRSKSYPEQQSLPESSQSFTQSVANLSLRTWLALHPE